MAYIEKKIGAERSFLNEPFFTSLTSNISYKVVLTTYKEKLQEEELYDDADIGFSMSDCNKSISLDFNISNEDETRNSQHKLDVIISICQAMKRDIDLARIEVEKGKKRWEELDIKDEEGLKSIREL